MSKTIAIAGKGGVGKTTLASLLVRGLLKAGRTPVLTVDADPNANLNESLGVAFDRTVISTVDELMERKDAMPSGVPRDRYLEFGLHEALVEAKGFDLLVMGRGEGAGCYCRANDLLRVFMDRLSGGYPYVVMDNEAGLEHLSRRTTRNVDALLIAATPSAVALRSAGRIRKMTEDLGLNIRRTYLVLTALNPDLNGRASLSDLEGLPLVGSIPYDDEVARRSVEAEALMDLSDESPAVRAVEEILARIGV